MPATGLTPIDFKKDIDYASLSNRNILITGGASGFGKAFVQTFAKHGANIVVADVQDGPGKDLEKELEAQGAKIKYVHADVTSFDSQVFMIREALDFFPRNEIDIFIPNAGILTLPTTVNPQDPAGLADLKGSAPDINTRLIEINLGGVWTGTMLVLRYGMGLHKAPEGGHNPTKSVVLIDSLAGYCGAEGSVEYTTSKFGVRGLMRGIRKQLAGLNVRINSVCPFYVDTPMTAHATPVLKQLGIPMCTVEQVVEGAARLATDEKAWGRALFLMPEGPSDGGDDSVGLQSGKAFSTEAFGDHWALLINGPLSDDIPAPV